MVLVENDDAQAIRILDISDDEHDESVSEEANRSTQYEGDTLDISRSLIGVKRHSFEQMYELYCQHALEIGFTVRKHSARSNTSGQVVQRYYVCSNHGLRRNQDKPKERKIRNITRTDCKAHMRVKKCDDGMLEVVGHFEEHNHTLTRKEWSHRHKSQRQNRNEKGDIIENMVSSGIQASDSYMAEVGDENPIGHMMQDNLNLATKMKTIEAGDAQSLIDKLCQASAENGDFFYRIKLDVDGRLSSIFWRDSMMCEDYQIFGDVVVFDTTYRTNRYGLICAAFVGLNSHKKNVMFGCAFINDEKIETFQWLFEIFLKSMKMKCPVTIFTDQDRAITSAITKVFPTAKHRLCIWHLYQNAVGHFGNLKGNNAFKNEFEKCLTGCVDEAEFMECWTSMIEAHDLQENSWFARLYELRDRWSTSYNKSYFSAGILSSLKNSLGFKASISTNLNEFYTIFKRTIQKWRAIEEVDEFQCSRSKPTSRLPLVGMLKHASEVYTLSIFTDFEDALLKSISTTVNVVGEELEMKMYDVEDPDNHSLHRVNFCGLDNFISCTCKRFEEYGLLCCHCLRILDRNSIKDIPSCKIMRRWTKFAKKDLWDKVANARGQVTGPWRHKMARNYYSLVVKSEASEEGRKIIEEGYQRMSVEIQALTAVPDMIEDSNPSTSSISVQEPAEATPKGRKKRVLEQI